MKSKNLVLGILGATIALSGCKREKNPETVAFLNDKYSKENNIDSSRISYLLKNNVPFDSCIAYERLLPLSILDSDYLQESVHKIYSRNLFPSMVRKYNTRNLANLELCSRYNVGPDIDNNLPDGFWAVKKRLYEYGVKDVNFLKNDFNLWGDIVLILEGHMGTPKEYVDLLEKGKKPSDYVKYMKLNTAYGSKINLEDIKYFEENKIPFEKIEQIANDSTLINRVFK